MDTISTGLVVQEVTRTRTQKEETIGAVLRTHASRHPDLPAILAPGREPVSFAGLIDSGEHVRRRLNNMGVACGHIIAVALSNRADMAALMLSVVDCATCAPIDPGISEEEFRNQLIDLNASALILAADSGSLGRTAANSLGIPVLDVSQSDSKEIGCFTLEPPTSFTGPSRQRASALPDDTAFLLRTSGTTGTPTLVPWSHSQFVRQARVQADWLGLTHEDRGISIMPMHHGAAINSALLMPLLPGGGVVCMERFFAASFFQTIVEFQATWYTAGVTYQQEILARASQFPHFIQGSKIRFIRSGSGPLHEEVQTGLEDVFDAPVIQRYGQTETIGTVTCNPLPPGHRKPGTVGVPVGCDVRIVDDAWHPLPAGSCGEITVCGPSVITAPETGKIVDPDGWLRTGDVGFLDTDGYLTITGRVSEMINRGGEKIAPVTVEVVLSRHPAVRAAKVLAMPHPTLGQEVAAGVVLQKRAEASPDSLIDFTREFLPPAAYPKRILILDSMPLGPTGKPDRAALSEMLVTGPTAGSTQKVLTPVETDLSGMWSGILGQPDIDLDDNFFALGGDSLNSVELLIQVEAEYGVEFSSDSIYAGASTIRSMARSIEEAMSTGSDTNREAPATVDPSGTSEQMFICRNDVMDAFTFFMLAPIAWLLPEKARQAACTALARLHIYARGSKAAGLDKTLASLEGDHTARALETMALEQGYDELVRTLHAYRPLPHKETVRIHGASHIETALAAGKGAVLWASQIHVGRLAWKRTFKDAGWPLVYLRSDIHPYSGTRFGRQFLNPIRTKIEDRYLDDAVTLLDGDGTDALKGLGKHIAHNRLVAISASGSSGRTVQMPFLGGSLQLSLGAPTLAKLHDAPLLPVTVLPDNKGGFDIYIEDPLMPRPGETVAIQVEQMARDYATILERFVRRKPSAWRGWFTRSTWRPADLKNSERCSSDRSDKGEGNFSKSQLDFSSNCRDCRLLQRPCPWPGAQN